MTFDNNRFFLFENCKPVRGVSNSIICDLQRKDFCYIPNELYDLLIEHNGKKTKELLNYYDKDLLNEYFDFLNDGEYIHVGNYKNLFSKIDLSFYEPSEVNNCIVDLLENLDPNYLYEVAYQLEELRCKNLEIRCYNSLPVETICNFLSFLEENGFFLINIGLVFSDENILNEIEELKELLIKFPRITYLLVFNSKKNEFIPPIRNNGTGYIVLLNTNISSSKSCGNICQEYFVCNIEAFTESLNYNSCLNKKISIDAKGNIKNCPSMAQSFGNIKNTTLENALNHPEFKKYWGLTKDSIEVCRDCEFRYICTDCRAYTEQTNINNEDLDISKPLKCGYNPYTGDWEEWSTILLKQKAIKYYGMQDLVKR